MDELYQAISIVVGAFTAFAGFVFVAVKFAEPIKNFFSKVKKTDNIDINNANIKKLGGESQTQNKQIELLQNDITLIEGRLGSVEGKIGDVEEKIDTISAGVKHLLGTSLGYVNDPEAAKIAYRNFK